eukprot:CAMPEP_0201496506 /NCGR_PEP_ID=MMETSP0151_2-20130828/60133_1 /ASSEMBLY_ACC=CAM_ASM_000257 /TAXON_ID=200890 /ORGANISM="Paramoeba atlantica, Strain 621/1 / CCAP 1560/9" /LENGTH=45 /DNA_ID= /DNA_START= /DNA_END= /DNA_ORIENTATION=
MELGLPIFIGMSMKLQNNHDSMEGQKTHLTTNTQQKDNISMNQMF